MKHSHRGPVAQGDARRVPLRPGSANLVVMSPPYFGLRVYTDAGVPVAAQLGGEDNPRSYVQQLWKVMEQAWTIITENGSCIVNLGDKFCAYSGEKWGNGRSLGSSRGDSRVPGSGPRSAPALYGVPPKSLMGIPERFIIGLLDGEGVPDVEREAGRQWTWRQEIIWSKANGMPESVTDRCRRSHEVIYHLTKTERYYANMDEIREPYSPATKGRYKQGYGSRADYASHRKSVNGIAEGTYDENPLGKLPGSVWEINTEPLQCPDYIVDAADGWQLMNAPDLWRMALDRVLRDGDTRPLQVTPIDHYAAFPSELPRRFILAYSPPGGVVVDLFGGAGTTAMAARALGRVGINLDLSLDYCRLASWRIMRSGHGAKVVSRTNGQRQLSLMDAAPPDRIEVVCADISTVG